MKRRRELGCWPRGARYGLDRATGHRLPVHKLLAAIPRAVASLKPEAELAAEAIRPSTRACDGVTRTIELPGKDALTARGHALGHLQGLRDIVPSWKDDIALVTIDRGDQRPYARDVAAAAMSQSFNSLTVDGDMSTNDCVFALANGPAQHAAQRSR